ncbi:hypothetical protein Bca101_045438 [Brassica carinata]
MQVTIFVLVFSVWILASCCPCCSIWIRSASSWRSLSLLVDVAFGRDCRYRSSLLYNQHAEAANEATDPLQTGKKIIFQQQLCEWHLYMDDMSTIIAVKLRKKLGCRMCEKFQLTGMKVTTQQQENNLFKTENITSSIYDPSEASIGWSIVMGSMADQFFYFRLLSDKEGHEK